MNHLEKAAGDSDSFKPKLKTSISLSESMDAKWLSGPSVQPLSPVEYQFLLRRPSAVTEELVEDAVLAIGSASSPLTFRDTVLNALHLILFQVKHSKVFLLDSDTGDLVCHNSENDCFPLPKSGVLWEAVRRRSAGIIKISDTIKPDDPLRKLLSGFKFLEREQVVLINPIVEKKHHGVIALLVVVCDEPTVSQVERLRWVAKNVVVAATRVLKQVCIERDCCRSVGMLNVCSELIDLDTTSLSTRILKHIKSILDVKMCALFLISEGTQELVCPAQNEVALEKETRIELSTHNIYGRCFLNSAVIILDDVSMDARFNPATDSINGYEPCSMMCLPIVVHKGEDCIQQTVGVVAVCDKVDKKPFNARDQESMQFVLRFSSSVIANTLAYQRELTLKKQNQALLQIARNLFSQLSDLSVLLKEIMNEARSLTNAERCSLFLLDQSRQELVAAVFDSHLATEEDTIRIKVGQGIAGLVAHTGRFVNIKDAYKHPQFFRDMDENTGFRTRNLLCFPIKDHQGQVVGVAELCNKIGGNFFTTYDEELATTFSVYCGISLYQSQLYKKMNESQGRSKLATELMIYHMQVFSEDVEKFTTAPIPPCKIFDEKFASIPYSPRSLPEAETVTAVMSMMTEMNLLDQWKIDRSTLAKFLLMVKKGYRDPPYHNWFHALSVAHFCYVLHQLSDGFAFLDDLETLALYVACLCHDIDHRGTNNAFQVSSNSTLASLYSSEGSVMERHHFAQTVCILNSEGCNIFENLSQTRYKKVLDLIQHNILSTDIAHHLREMKGFEEMAAVGYQESNPDHHMQMCSLLMTCCDLSSTCKEWEWSKRISDLIYTEFFTQGDLERALGNTPMEMMDRNKAFVPDQQLGFMRGIAGPAYQILGKLIPKLAPAYENMERNKRMWEEMAREGKQQSSE